MSAFPVTIEGHFDGHVIVPERGVDLPVNQRLRLVVEPSKPAECRTKEERRAAFDRLVSRAVGGEPIPDEALRREHLYEERV